MKLEQAVELDPPDVLSFKGPFTEVKTSYLKLTNTTTSHIYFKVKTTAPKTYCVRPNGGVICPQETVFVAVMLQPFDPKSEDRSRDKFMVQGVFIADSESFSESMWQDTENVMNAKLKCMFDLPQAPEVTTDAAEQPKTEGKIQVIPEVKVRDADHDGKKLQEENKRLLSELHNLRQENSSLKEEGLRSRMARTKATSSVQADPHLPPPAPPGGSVQAFVLSPLVLGLALAALAIGIAIGKIVL